MCAVVGQQRGVVVGLRRVGELLWRLLVTTVGSCMRYRVTGLAAEAAFFAILSLPPLIFALAGAVGIVSERFADQQVAEVRAAVIDLASRALTDSAVDRIIVPTIDEVLRGGRYDIISIGFVLALWSGSRALNVFVDTITIMHGLGGHRGIVKTRALSFLLYVMGLVTGVVTIPLVVAGPTLVRRWVPDRFTFLENLYWPTVLVLCICFLATLYHVSVPVRTNWSFNLPGATFSLASWILGSWALRWVLTETAAESKSIYGPLAAPIAVFLWLYVVAIVVLIGAAVNAAFDEVFPQASTTLARRELMQRLRSRVRTKESWGRATWLQATGAIAGSPATAPWCTRFVTVPNESPAIGKVELPERTRAPWLELGRRLLIAFGIVAGTVLLVWLDRDGYVDGNDPKDGVNLIDAIYYTTVTLSTTGYGDITPVSDSARLVNAFIITPARIAFLVLLIGTTIEVLATQGRNAFRVARWRRSMGDHVVVIGYGTKGRSAVATLLTNGWPRESVVIVDTDAHAVADAHADDLAVVTGDATRREVLRRAGVSTARQVIITTDRDDTNVLGTLTVRQLNPDASIVTAVREHENVPLVRQSGASSVITSSDAVGRLLGLSTLSPTLGQVMEDLLTHGEGLEVAERDLLVSEVGRSPHSLPDQVIAVIRDEKVHRYFDPIVTQLARGDRLVVVRSAHELPWAPRLGTHGEDAAHEA